MTRAARRRLGALALAPLAGCADAPPAAAEPATFTAIYAAMFPLGTRGRCNDCHNRPPNELSNGRLDQGETRAAAYAALVGRPSASAHCGGGASGQVTPGDPEASLLYLKVRASPPCGDRMPQGGSPLTDAQVEMICSWIAAGAPDN